jgi:hypothetical protein
MLSKMVKSHDEASHSKKFNPASEDDEQDLKNWCWFHWESLFRKGIQSFNAPTYHDCCLSFSKKGYVKKNTHPPLQSASVLKIPGLKKATSPEELHIWLRERIEEHQRLGRKPVFPTINSPHLEEDSEEREDECSQSAELLKKRCQNLVEMQKNSEEKIKKLTEDNQRLLASSKTWCLKYQELLASREDEKYSFAELTPQKALKHDDSNSSLLMF